jgi:hypothetical protein
MKYICYIFAGTLLAGLLSAGPLLADKKIDPPETLFLKTLAELYQPVLFDHLSHSENFACNSCHHHAAGEGAATPFCGRCHSHSSPRDEMSCSGCHTMTPTRVNPAGSPPPEPLYHIDIPLLKSAFHLQCLGCHRRENEPVGCVDCHLFAPEGRKRFRIKTADEKNTGIKQ